MTQNGNVCAFCGYPGIMYEGGYRRPGNHNIEIEHFCCEEHFDRWLTWKAALALFEATERTPNTSVPEAVIAD